MYEVGDKFEIEIAEIFSGEYELHGDSKLYRIKGFNSLVFDENGLNKLKRIEQKPKTIKASELAIDTKVICWDEEEEKDIRCFATLLKGCLYAYLGGSSSMNGGSLVPWEHMTLEDGTIVLPE